MRLRGCIAAAFAVVAVAACGGESEADRVEEALEESLRGTTVTGAECDDNGTVRGRLTYFPCTVEFSNRKPGEVCAAVRANGAVTYDLRRRPFRC